jgi:hypothetical protein
MARTALVSGPVLHRLAAARPCHWPAGSLRAIHGGGLRRRRLPWPCVEQRTAMSPPRPVSDRRPRLVTSRLVPRPVPHRPARPARCAGASMKGESGGRCRRRGQRPPWWWSGAGRLFCGPLGRRRSPGAPLCWERSQRAARAASVAPGLRLRPLPRTGQEMRQATAFVRRLGDPGRASACTRPTGTPAPPRNTSAA